MIPDCRTRREFLKAAGVGAVSLLAPGWDAAASCYADVKSGKKPNYVMILIDDLGWKDATYMGSKVYETPNIDRLAAQGIKFTNAYANAPNCAPSRACLLSGQYTPRHGIYTVKSSERGPEHLRRLIPTPNRRILDPAVVTIADALKAGGYTCASIGKWHLGEGSETGPTAQGFDVSFGGSLPGAVRSHFSPYKTDFIADGPEGEYLTDRLTDEAIDFIESNKQRPFFLYLSHYAVHTPIQAKAALKQKYKQKLNGGERGHATYAAMIESVDRSVGRISRTLERLNLDRNTVVIFYSDNGGHPAYTSMEPLRGCKGTLYEGGIRVPLAIRWPGVIESGRVNDTMVIGTDLYPTMLKVARVDLPPEMLLDGVDLTPLLLGDTKLKSRPLFWHFPAYLASYPGYDEPWRATPAGAVRVGDWKLIEFFEDNRLELYNLRDDIGEQHNLAERKPDKTRELHELMRRWRVAVNAPVPRTRNPNYNPALQTERQP